MVRFGPQLAVASPALIATLRKRLDPINECVILTPPQFKFGAKVRVGEGAFAGLVGVFANACGSERVAVLLSVLGRETVVRLPRSALCAA